MSFSVGDKIVFKRDTIIGEIISIETSYRVTVLCSDGFEISASLADLVKIEEGTANKDAYSNHFDAKDSEYSILESVKSKKHKKHTRVLTVDLHVESLGLGGAQLDNSELIRIQLEKCYEAIERAINSNIAKLEIIHGIGKGVLRNEVHSILKTYKIRFYLTQDEGATVVFF